MGFGYQVTHTSIDALEEEEGTKVSLAGRVVFWRKLGKVAFGKLADSRGVVQFAFNMRETPETFKEWVKSIKMGSLIAISGRMWTSSTGEFTVLVDDDFRLLRNPMHPFPNKWGGIVDPELKLRKRYLDIALDADVRARFRTRSRLIQMLRLTLDRANFMEVETPILSPHASGAQAKTFVTHHNALDAEMHMRIAPETFLKRAVAAGFEKVFEIGKQFRNEGMDPSHLQEFTSVEWYAAHWDYKDNLRFFNDIVLEMFLDMAGHDPTNPESRVTYQGVELNFHNPPVKTYREVCLELGGFDPFELEDWKEVDERFKADVRPKLIQPIFLIDYPAHMSPLAQRSEDGKTVEQWQFIVNGWELVKAYTELTDPVLQRELLEEQMAARGDGDEEAMMLEEDFLECMEYGMPPMSGLGLGLDRLVAILTDQTSLRDVVLFPTVL